MQFLFFFSRLILLYLLHSFSFATCTQKAKALSAVWLKWLMQARQEIDMLIYRTLPLFLAA